MQRIRAGKTAGLLMAAGLFVIGGVLVMKPTASPAGKARPGAESKKAGIRTPTADPLAETIRKDVSIRKGETFVTALARLGFSAGDAHRIALAIHPVYPIRRVHPGHEIRLFLRNENPMNLEYDVDRASMVKVSWGGNGELSAFLHQTPYESRISLVSGRITTSLFSAILESGEDAALADLLASLFEYDIDFNRDIREGDTFLLLVEKRFLKGDFAGYGDVYSAEVKNRDRDIRIVRFTDSRGKSAYYHPDGRSVRKMFLRCPLPFMRVTSRYGRRRHPVLGFSARHNGVDLGARRGTPVKATASGVVTHAGIHRMKGRYIQLRHPNGYATHYYHLSRFARGIRRGIRVTQGQVIGRVGNTGMSTGPHLHYGVLRNGRFLNPLRLKSPSRKPVPPKEIALFRSHCRRVFFSMTAFAWVRGTMKRYSQVDGDAPISRALAAPLFSGQSMIPETNMKTMLRH